MTNRLGQYSPAVKAAAGLSAIALGGAALIVNRQAAKAEQSYPPKGSFIDVDGVRLHYVERGHGRPVVFLHGNGMMIEDVLISGVLDLAADRGFRAVAFDRPGFGHSERPRGVMWTAAAQAGLLQRAFAHLGLEKPIVVGHSLGAMVALALGLDHPDKVSGLVLASGYYYPSARADVVLVAPSATPLLGDLLCYTVTPLMGELLAPRLVRKMFSPQAVPSRFTDEFPFGLMLRPSQMSASTKDAAHMVPDAAAMASRYSELTCPVAILAGDSDAVVDMKSQPQRLHDALPKSMFDVFVGTGHMTLHADPGRVVKAIDFVEAAVNSEERRASSRPSPD